jgi:hypothetical protein
MPTAAEMSKRIVVRQIVMTAYPMIVVLYTEGMERFNQPNLLIRGVPVFLAPAAVHVLNDVAGTIVGEGSIEYNTACVVPQMSMPFRLIHVGLPAEYALVMSGNYVEVSANADDYPVCDKCKEGAIHKH